jgi:hypothetical protein
MSYSIALGAGAVPPQAHSIVLGTKTETVFMGGGAVAAGASGIT